GRSPSPPPTLRGNPHPSTGICSPTSPIAGPARGLRAILASPAEDGAASEKRSRASRGGPPTAGLSPALGSSRPMRVTSFTVPPLKNDAYLIVDETSLEAAVIDPGLGAQKILASLKLSGAVVKYILNTHGHPDHTADDPALREATGARLGIHEVDAYWLERNAKDARPFLEKPVPAVKADLLLKEGTEMKLGNTVLRTMHTPGHSPGSACFHVANEGVL